MAETETLKKLLEFAENRYHNGAYDRAILMWEKALKLDPENGRARQGIKMARILLDAGNSDLPTGPSLGSAEPPEQSPEAPDPSAPIDGVGDLAGLLERNQAAESSILEHIARGWEHLKNGDREAAQQECAEALILDGSNADALKLHQALSGEEVPVAEPVGAAAEASAAGTPAEQPIALGEQAGDHPIPTVTDGIGAPPSVEPPAPPAAEEEPPDLPQVDPAALGPEPEEAGKPEETGKKEEEQLIPDALQAGGTEYGQWESEFSELDLDDSVQRVGTRQIPVPDADPQIAVGDGTAAEQEGAATGDLMPGLSASPEGMELPAGEDDSKAAEPPLAVAPLPENAGDGDEPEFTAPVLTAEVPEELRKGKGGMLAVALGVFVIAGLVGGWFFLRGRTGTAAGRLPDGTPAAGGAESPDVPPGPPVDPAPTPAGSPSRGSNAEEILLPAKPESAGTDVAPPVPQTLTDREMEEKVNSMIRSGRELYRKERYEQAQSVLSAAMALDPMNFELRDLLEEVSSKAAQERRAREAIDVARRAFADGDFEITLRKLYRTPTGAEQEPTRTYIRNTWFNWGVQLLKAGNCSDASRKFQEVLDISPQDQEVLKLKTVADRYSNQAKDEIYYAFIEQVRPRTLDSP